MRFVIHDNFMANPKMPTQSSVIFWTYTMFRATAAKLTDDVITRDYKAVCKILLHIFRHLLTTVELECGAENAI
jgi:hypothetical protein